VVINHRLKIGDIVLYRHPWRRYCRFDYRPFIVNWCIKVRLLDGCKVSDKEGWADL